MTVDVLILYALSGLILLMTWLMPRLMRPTLPFGVRVPGEYADAPVIVRSRVAYHRWVAVAGVVVLGVGLAAFTVVPALVVGALTVLVVSLLWLPAYLRAHRAIRATKHDEGWYASLDRDTGEVASDTALRARPERFPWLWMVPALALLAVTIVIGIVRYPTLPPSLALHYNAYGNADRIVATSIRTAFAPVFIQAGVTVLILAVTLLAFRSTPDLDPAAPASSARQYKGFVVRTAKAILLLAACVNLSLLVAVWQTWNGAHTFVLTPVLVPILAGIGLVVAVGVRTGQHGSRLPVADGEERTGVVRRDDDGSWRLGLFYVNRADSALLVPKRFGIGWTVNFGNPRAVALLLVLLALPITISLLVR